MALGHDETTRARGFDAAKSTPTPKRPGADAGDTSSHQSWPSAPTRQWSPSPLAVADRLDSVERARQSAQKDPAAIQMKLGAGAPLPAPTRERMQVDLGYDLSNVRVHNDSKAAESAASLGAKAFTVGSSIAFGSGHYEPGSRSGDRLLRHELSHVVQQAGGSASLGLGRPGSSQANGLGPASQEKEADRVADRGSRGSSWFQGAVASAPAARPSAVQLEPLPWLKGTSVQLEPDPKLKGAADKKKEPETFEYTVKQGDTLWDLAARFLGNANQWQEIHALNPHIQDPNLIQPGEKVKIPKRQPGEVKGDGAQADGAPGADKEKGALKEKIGDKDAPKDGDKDAKGEGGEKVDEKAEAKEKAPEEGEKRGDDAKEGGDKAEPGPQVPGPVVAGPAGDAPAQAQGKVDLPKQDGAANDQVKAWLQAHPNPARESRVQNLDTVTNRISASAENLKINLPFRGTPWGGLNDAVGSFMKDFRDVPFKGKNVGGIQKALNVLHQVTTGVDKVSSIVGMVGVACTVGGAILTLLAPPVGAFLLAAGRIANVIGAAMAGVKFALSIAQTALSAVAIAKEKDPEKLAQLIGHMEKQVEGGLMAGLDVVLSKTGVKGAQGNLTKGLGTKINFKVIAGAFKSGGIKGVLKEGMGQLGKGLKTGFGEMTKGLKGDFAKLKGSLNLKGVAGGMAEGMRGTMLKPFKDITHAFGDLKATAQAMKGAGKEMFTLGGVKNALAANFPTLNKLGQLGKVKKAMDTAKKGGLVNLERMAAKKVKKLGGEFVDMRIDPASRFAKAKAMFKDLTDANAGGFAKNIKQGMAGTKEYNAGDAEELLKAKKMLAFKEAKANLPKGANLTSPEFKKRYDELLTKHLGANKELLRVTHNHEINLKAGLARIDAGAKGDDPTQAGNFTGMADTALFKAPGLKDINEIRKGNIGEGLKGMGELPKQGMDLKEQLGPKKEDVEAKAVDDAGTDAVATDMKKWVQQVQQASLKQQGVSAENQLDMLMTEAVHAMGQGRAPAPKGPVAQGPAPQGPAPQGPAPQNEAPAPRGPELPAIGPGSFEQLAALDAQIATLDDAEKSTQASITDAQQAKTTFAADKAKVDAAKRTAADAEAAAAKKSGETVAAQADVDKGIKTNEQATGALNKSSTANQKNADQANDAAKKPVNVEPKEKPQPPPKEEKQGFFGKVWGGIKKAASWVGEQAMKLVKGAIATVTSAVNKVKAYFTDLIMQLVMGVVKKFVDQEQGNRIDQAMLLHNKQKLAKADAQLQQTRKKAVDAKAKAEAAKTAVDARLEQADKSISDGQALLAEIKAQRAAVEAERGALKGELDAFVAAHSQTLADQEKAQANVPARDPGVAHVQGGAAGDGAQAQPVGPKPVPGGTIAKLTQAADLVDATSTAAERTVDGEASTATANVLGSLKGLPVGEASRELQDRATKTGEATRAEHAGAQQRRREKVKAARDRIAGLATQANGDQEVARLGGELKAVLGGVQADRNAALNGMYQAFADLTGEVKDFTNEVATGAHGKQAKKDLGAAAAPQAG